MAFVSTADGGKIYYEYHSGAKLPVLLIHGWGTSVRIWDTTLPALKAAGHAVLAFDQRGCGSSDKDFAQNTISLGAQDAIAVMQAAGVTRCAVNGWSLGGAIAVETASVLGAACAGVVLTAAASPRYVQSDDYAHGGAPGSATATVGAMQADRANFFDALTTGVFASPPSQFTHSWIWSLFMQTSPVADDALAELDVLDQRKILQALDVPVLSVVGAKDVIVAPDVCRSVADYAKRCKVIEFENSGHAPFIEDGPAYRSAVLEFLKTLS